MGVAYSFFSNLTTVVETLNRDLEAAWGEGGRETSWNLIWRIEELMEEIC